MKKVEKILNKTRLEKIKTRHKELNRQLKREMNGKWFYGPEMHSISAKSNTWMQQWEALL